MAEPFSEESASHLRSVGHVLSQAFGRFFFVFLIFTLFTLASSVFMTDLLLSVNSCACRSPSLYLALDKDLQKSKSLSKGRSFCSSSFLRAQ